MTNHIACTSCVRKPGYTFCPVCLRKLSTYDTETPATVSEARKNLPRPLSKVEKAIEDDKKNLPPSLR